MKSERKYSKHNELLISEPSGDANNLPLIHQGRHLSARQTALQCRGKYQSILQDSLLGGKTVGKQCSHPGFQFGVSVTLRMADD